MKVTEKKVDNEKVQLDATATSAEVDQAFQMAQAAFAQQTGLRPDGGKSVAQVAEEQLGIKDLDSIVEPQVNEYLVPFALDKKNIIPAFPPAANAKTPLKRGQEYSFSLLVNIKPEYELESYDPVSITILPLKVNPAEVEEQLAHIAEGYAEYVADDPHPLASGDSCLLEIKASMGGKPFAGLSTEGRTYTTGAGLMPDGFDENIIGMDVGETKSFTFEGPSVDDKGNETTDVVDCTVTVKEVQKRVIPAITDAWVKKSMPLFKDAQALRENVESQILKARTEEYEAYKRQVAGAELLKRFKGSIADEVYEATQQSMLSNIRADLQRQGMTFEQFVEQNGGEQQFNMMMMMQIRETLVQGYALDALFRHENLKISDEDILEACATMNPQQPQMFREQMEKSGRMFAIRELAERLKANKWLVEHADIKIDEGKTVSPTR